MKIHGPLEMFPMTNLNDRLIDKSSISLFLVKIVR